MRKETVKLVIASALLGGMLGAAMPRMIELYSAKIESNKEHSCSADFVPVRPKLEVVTDKIQSFKIGRKEASDIAVAAIGASDKYQLDVELVIAVMGAESSFQWKAVSKKKAHGLMQVKPKWWKNVAPHDMTTKVGNVYAGAYVLAYYRDRLGSIDEAVKAYNVGITDYMKGANTEAADRYYDRVASVNKKFNEMD